MLADHYSNAVRVMHIPTGITVETSHQKRGPISKHKLLRTAMRVLRAKLYSARTGLNQQPAPIVREYDLVRGVVTDTRTGVVHTLEPGTYSPEGCTHALLLADVHAATARKE